MPVYRSLTEVWRLPINSVFLFEQVLSSVMGIRRTLQLQAVFVQFLWFRLEWPADGRSVGLHCTFDASSSYKLAARLPLATSSCSDWLTSQSSRTITVNDK